MKNPNRNSNMHYKLDEADHDGFEKSSLPGVVASTGESKKQGEISNIEKLYNKVKSKDDLLLMHNVAEFSMFSKNLTEKAPKAKSGLQDFLSMFD